MNEAAKPVAQVIRRASIVAAGVAAVLSPIPLADEAALLPVYAWLTLRIARTHGTAAAEVPWRPLTKAALLGLAARATVNLPFATVPGVAAAVNAATAVVLTQVYGACVDHACSAPPGETTFEPRAIVDLLRERARRWADGACATPPA